MKGARAITSAPADGAIVGAVIAMAGKLNMRVIAEGVETQEQMEYLRSLGCQEMQGYFFSKPLPADEFSKLLTVSR
ncbi:MAG TPA: EAL domain-containing protein [Nitrospirota bacterium]